MGEKRFPFRMMSISISVLSLLLQNLSLFDLVHINDGPLFVIIWVLPIAALIFAIVSYYKYQSVKDILLILLAFISLVYRMVFVIIAWFFLGAP